MKSKMIIISSCIAFFVLGLVFLPGIVYDLPFFEPIDFSQFKYTCCAGRRISENQEYAAYGCLRRHGLRRQRVPVSRIVCAERSGFQSTVSIFH